MWSSLIAFMRTKKGDPIPFICTWYPQNAPSSPHPSPRHPSIPPSISCESLSPTPMSTIITQPIHDTHSKQTHLLLLVKHHHQLSSPRPQYIYIYIYHSRKCFGSSGNNKTEEALLSLHSLRLNSPSWMAKGESCISLPLIISPIASPLRWSSWSLWSERREGRVEKMGNRKYFKNFAFVNGGRGKLGLSLSHPASSLASTPLLTDTD
jgi:hypothetical protein